MLKLTERQQQILNLIRQSIQTKGAPPTRAEIAQIFGFKSPNAAEEHLKALARKGAIELSSGTSRGIRLLTEDPSPDFTHSNDFINLPLIGRVAAGHPILATEHIDTHISVDPHLFKATPDFLLKVKGLSMRDVGILDGDLLAVKKSSQAHHGQIVVARINDEVTVKRFHQSSTGILLIAENPDFSPIVVDPSQDFSIEGLAVGLLRSSLN